MNGFVRKQVGETLTYKDHTIIARHVGPDLLCEVNGTELPNFYENTNTAHKAGMRYVDDIEKASKK